jgi:pilus assembly protein FimV
VAAINKRKLLESAQRNLQKGAVDKAIKDYQTVLEADPRDTNVRLKLGDLLQKAGRNDDAIAAYLKVADQFQRDGFDAKAVALYKQVTKIDAKRHDVYVPLADLYQRLGLVSEAMAALQTAAESYQRDGRKREALDLLRRMANLDPANVTSRLKVAELLQQEGLVEEAVAEFREAAAELERQGDWEARAGVLERIVETRPECVEELEALASAWLERGQPRRAHAFAQKLVEADPSRPESQELLAHVLAGLGQQELAIDAFRECAEAWRVRGEDGKAREIMQRHLPPQDFESLASATSSPEATMAGGTAAAADLFGSAGELGAEPAAGEGVFGSEPLELGSGGVVELGGDAPAFAGDESVVPPAPAPAPVAPAPAAAPPAPAPAARPAAARPAPAPARAAAPAPEPTGDVDQLLAEAAVYTRYGKHERALACLDAALAQDPAHGGVLEQLGEVHLAAGAPERAVEAWSRAATLAGEARDAARFSVLRARVESIDPAAAAALHAPVPAGAAAPTVLFEVGEGDPGATGDGPAVDADAMPAPDADALDDIEIDVDDMDLDAAEADQPASDTGEASSEGFELDLDLEEAAEEGAEESAGANDGGIELELDEESGPGATPEELPEPASSAAPDETDDGIVFDGESGPEATEPPQADEAPSTDQAWELPEGDELAVTAPPAAVPESAPPAQASEPSAVSAAAGELSMSAAQQIQEDFEEGGFYFDQGLLAEAEAVYLRILARAPGHPGALLRLGEIAVQRGAEPSAVTAPPAVADAATASEPEAPAVAPAAVPAPPAPALEETPDVEPPDALDLTAPTLDDAEAAGWSGEVAPPDEAEDSTASVAAAPHAIDDTTLRPEPVARVDETELTAPDLAQEEDPSGAAFDLAAELSEALSDSSPGARASAGTDEDGFASLFREFKRGVSQTLGEGDVETHFDLGIAYREMGLLEDAIGEFRYALGSPSRRLDALQLMGLCAIDLGRGQDAVGHLEQALASPEVPPEREAPLRYELGRAYQALPDRLRALEALRRVHELEPGYQDVAERIAALESGAAGEPEAAPEEESAEAFETFDDLVAEAAEDAPAAAPRYETFDDLVAEANDSESQGDDDETDGAAGGAAETVLDAETEAAFVDATLDDDDTATGQPALTPDAAVEPESQPAEPAAPAQRRRRKVSFF